MALPSLFGMPYGHSLSCLLIRRYHMSAVTFCLLLCVPRYQLAQTPVSPHGAAGQQKQPPPPWSAHQAREQSLSVGECDRVVDITPLTVWPLTFMLAHKAVPHGCRHLLFTTMCSTIPTSPDSGLTSRCSWTAKTTPPPPYIDATALLRIETLCDYTEDA